jgi:hypothetical protein
MTTKRQIAANRRNAKRSTGPKTPAGKGRSSQNRMTHGLLSRQVLLREEDPDRFREVWGALWEELRPQGELETYLAARIVSGIWRMNRIVRIEAQLFNEAPLRAVEPEAGIGKIFRLDCAHGGNAFAKLLRYETAIDRGIQRAYRQLATVQAARLAGDEEAAWEAGFLSEPPNEPVGAVREPPPPTAAARTKTTGANGRKQKMPLEPIRAQKQAESGPTPTRNAPSATGRGRAAPAPSPRNGTGRADGGETNGKLRKEPNRPPGRARQGSAGDRRSAAGEPPHPPPAPAGRAAPGGVPERELDLILGPPGAGGG